MNSRLKTKGASRKRNTTGQGKRVTAKRPRARAHTRTVVKHMTPPWMIGLCFVLGGGILMLALANVVPARSESTRLNYRETNWQQPMRWVPVSEKIASGQITVKSGSSVPFKVQITPDMRDARVIGKFTATGGSRNDIAAVLASEGEFTNWSNGHSANVYYSTEGRKTTDQIDVPLPPGTYIFAFSNKFSALTDKYVMADIQLDYSRSQ